MRFHTSLTLADIRSVELPPGVHWHHVREHTVRTGGLVESASGQITWHEPQPQPDPELGQYASDGAYERDLINDPVDLLDRIDALVGES